MRVATVPRGRQDSNDAEARGGAAISATARAHWVKAPTERRTKSLPPGDGPSRLTEARGDPAPTRLVAEAHDQPPGKVVDADVHARRPPGTRAIAHSVS